MAGGGARFALRAGDHSREVNRMKKLLLTVALLGFGATFAAAQTARVTASVTILPMTTVTVSGGRPAAANLVAGTSGLREARGVATVRVRSNAAWRVVLDPATLLGTRGRGERLYWRVREVVGRAEAAQREYTELVGGAIELARGSAPGTVELAIDCRWSGGSSSRVGGGVVSLAPATF